MIKKVTIKNVYLNDTKKDTGTKYVYGKGKNAGKNFTRVGIKTEGYLPEETHYTNAMAGERALNIKVGDTVVLKFTESKSDDGMKTFYNWGYPSNAEVELYEQLTEGQ